MSNPPEEDKSPESAEDEIEMAVEAVREATEGGQALDISRLPEAVRATLNRLGEGIGHKAEVLVTEVSGIWELRLPQPERGEVLSVYKRDGESAICGAQVAPWKYGVKKRGRPPEFTIMQLQKAYAAKIAGKGNNAAAKILYKTKTPTAQQRQSVSTILKYHAKRLTPPKK